MDFTSSIPIQEDTSPSLVKTQPMNFTSTLPLESQIQNSSVIPQTELVNNTRSIMLSEPQVNSQMDTLPSNSQMIEYTTSPTHQIVPQRQHNNNIRSNHSSLNTSTLPSTENENENFNSSVSTYRKKYDVSFRLRRVYLNM